MKLVQALPLASMAIFLYVAIFHAYMYFKKIGGRTNLSFTLVCLCLFGYAFFSFLNYNETSFQYNVLYIKTIYFTFLLFPVTFIHFVYDYTNQPSRRFPWILTVVCAVLIVMMFSLFFGPNDEKPVYVHLEMLDVTYVLFRGDIWVAGAKTLVISVVYAVSIYGIYLIFIFYRRGNTAARPILIGASLFFLCGVNDAFIELGGNSFCYLGEYGGLFLILGMAYALINQMAQANEELSRARVLSAVGKMATEVVHDLTTPLSAIKLAAAIAKKDDAGPNIQEKYLSLIEEETNRLSNLSYDILHFVNSDSTLLKKNVNIKSYMDDVLLLLGDVFKEHGIHFRIDIEKDGFVRLDPDAFKRVLVNLAVNARDSFAAQTEAGPEPEFVIGVSIQTRQAVFTFSDNGPGIPEEIKPHIFEPFSSHGKKFGTGLGLAISKQIVERHGGNLSCKTDGVRGTTFQISLPAGV